jgi:ribosomal-protein-alanine N-acetyltransferase
LHPNTFLVAELEGKVIGYTIGRKLDELAEVISIAVLPEFRRRGIGSALWLRLRDELKEMGVKTVRLHVRVSNEPAIRFYEKFGFERTRLEPSYYSDGEDAWLMKLEKL